MPDLYCKCGRLIRITEEQLKSLWAARSASMRRTKSGGAGKGQPKKPTPCKRCGLVLPSAREAWVHCLNAR